MSYTKNGLVEANDFNALVGNFFSTSQSQLNTVYSTGRSNIGYGQSPVGNVAVAQSVVPSNWVTLITTTRQVAQHQGSTVKNIVFPFTGSSIAFISDLSTNLNTINSNRLNTVTQGISSQFYLLVGYEWTNTLTFTTTINFANADAARYFFNSGGQISIQCTHPSSGSRSNQAWNDIAQDLGNIYLSSPTVGNCKIANTFYNGVTQTGGDFKNKAILSTNSGYFALRSSNITLATQTSRRASNPWRDTASIQVIAKTNGTQGTNSDNGSILTIYTKWNNLPENAGKVGALSTTYCTVHYPSDTYIGNTWGSVTVNWAVATS